jgi:uncharacterized protein (DUF342 family)
MSTDTLDQAVRVEVGEGGLCAKVVIADAKAGHAIDEPTIRAALAGAGILITREVTEAIRQAVGTIAGAAEAGPMRIEVARGEAARHGEAGRFELEPALLAEAPGKAAAAYRIVRAGTRLGLLTPATPGRDGRDVHGKTLTAREGRAFALAADESVKLDEAGVATAARDGLLEFSPPTLRVRDELALPGPIDLATGSIDFPGRVSIGAGVRDGFEVRATGRVSIAGLVEAATIAGEQDVVLAGGMAAREAGELSAGRDAAAKYLDSVRGRVGRDLHVAKEMITCRVAVGRALRAGEASLIGGETDAGGVIELDTLGSESGVVTVLRAGWIGRLERVATELAGLIPALEARMAKAQAALDQIKNVRGKPTASQAETLTEREFEAAAAREAVNRATGALERVRQCTAERTVVDVTIRSRVYAGVKIVAGRSEVKFERAVPGPVRIRLGPDGRARVTLPGDDEAAPAARNRGYKIMPIDRDGFAAPAPAGA